MDTRLDDIFPVKAPDILATRGCNMGCKYCFEPSKRQGDNMDVDRLLEYFSYNPARSCFPFGGEPLLVLDSYIELIKKVSESSLPKKIKQEIIKKTRQIITNGTLIKANRKKIKDWGFHMQISFDGPEHVHNLYRVFPNGKGSYDKVMEGIMVCIEDDIPWSIHGVVAKDTIKYMFDIFTFYFEFYRKYKGNERAIDFMSHNNFQVIFEDNYDDNDIDVLIHEYHRIVDWIYKHKYLSDKEKNLLFTKFFEKKGGVCSSGASLMAVGTNFDFYLCHRLAAVPDNEKYRVGNLFEPYDIEHKEEVNAFTEIARKKKMMYSSVTINDGFKGDNVHLFMWCPATNLQESGNPYYQPCKYNVMFSEVNRVIPIFKEAYYIK